MLNAQMCPICGLGPWKSPLNHVARAHHIDRLTMRDICGLSTRDKVTDENCREAWSANGKQRIDVLASNSAKITGTRGRKNRRTRRAVEVGNRNLLAYEKSNPEAMAAIRAGFRERMATPEARAKWEVSMQRARAEKVYTPEQRAAAVARLESDAAKAKRAAFHAARKHDGCVVEGCSRAHCARGYCKLHWRRWKLYGDPLKQGTIGAKSAINSQQQQIALEMLAAGSSQRSVADHLDCGPGVISRLVKRTASGPG